ncbi:uncharacterized protein PRCAT00001702001 [Priceomyces carsonii]|uniref:uncharacterized protein n=1 Tax=Priceomyces carsonii TaxID=28549 RepID=UPI002ED939EB|nr:unnamed protein product [Priceomyces carsonii]
MIIKRQFLFLGILHGSQRSGITKTVIQSKPLKFFRLIGSKLTSLPLPDWDRGGRKEKESLTPLYASMKKMIEQNTGCVCLIQVGSFYELYFEQAEDYGPQLGLRVATRKTSNYNIPMAGFPVYQLQKFVKILIQELQVNVAIIDQYPTINKTTDTIIHRKISRIVSPGTLVDESFMNYNQNNYLVSISFPSNFIKAPADPDMSVGLSWIDLSVGDFHVQETTLVDLVSDLSRINPSEVIISKDFQEENLMSGAWYPGLQDLKKYFTRYHKTVYEDLKHRFRSNIQATRKQLENFSVREEAAMNMILSYIKVNLPDSNPSLDIPSQYWKQNCLQMDPRTREALELTERSTIGHGSLVGSFLSTIRRTVTNSGARLLTQWIKAPILDIEELKRRQSFVTIFKENFLLRISLRTQLSQLGDFVRSVQRLALGTGDQTIHLAAIGDGLTKLENLKIFLINETQTNDDLKNVLEPFLANFDVPTSLAYEINQTINHDYQNSTFRNPSDDADEKDPECIVSAAVTGSYRNSAIESYKDRGLRQQDDPTFAVKRHYNKLLNKLHESLDELKEAEKEMLSQTQNQLSDIDEKLIVRKKEQLGRHSKVLHISGRQKLILSGYERLKEHVKEKRKGSLLYNPPAWIHCQLQLQDKIDAIKIAEDKIIEKLRIKVLDSITTIRRINKEVDFLDVTSSFAVLAEEANFVCPEIVELEELTIKDGRHIVVESGLRAAGEMFMPNDTYIGTDSKMWVITGPNMGGKSTFLRQNALIVILAQMGSYVPASFARIGVVDKIFTRIGASDDLFSDLSTFMVEMVEASNILQNATSRSLAIVDEIGRGTSGKEGLAIAYATLLSLLEDNRCRTLFATHYGRELDFLLGADNVSKDAIRFFRTRVLEKKSSSEILNLIIDHVLEKGISERSYALEVAQKAGFPSTTLSNANRALKLLATNHL